MWPGSAGYRLTRRLAVRSHRSGSCRSRVTFDHLPGSQVPSGFADPTAFGEPISLALAYIGFIGLQNSRAEKPLLFPRWISGIVGAADLLLAMVLGSVLLLGPRSGGGSVLSTRRQRPMWDGRDDGKRPGPGRRRRPVPTWRNQSIC